MVLKNKKILLAVCGSVSFYKAYEIISALKKLNAEIYVMLSNGALNFASAMSFEAVCGHEVLCESSQNWARKLSHIEFAKMDLVLIAPATTNTINCLANGISRSVFMDTLMAASGVKTLIAPAANTAMLNHFATKNSLEILRKNGYEIIEPVCKRLACGDIGKGALADVQNIVFSVLRAILCDKFYENKNVVVTGGATYEKIDDIRAITNFSSGKMALNLANVFYFLGANVTLITSVDLQNLPYKTLKFLHSNELKERILKSDLKENDFLIMAAAVSDFIPKNPCNGKIKKDNFGSEFSLNFIKNEDILKNLGLKCKKIGFKLETDEKNALQNAKNMLKNKNLDAVCLNILGQNVKFGSDKSEITFITNEKTLKFDLDEKANIALKIAIEAKNL